MILVRGLVKSLGAPTTPVTLAPEHIAGSGASAPIPVEFTGATPAVFRQREEKAGPAYEPLVFFANTRSVQLPAAPAAGHYLLTTMPGPAAGLRTEPALGAALTPISMNHSASESALAPLTAADLARLLPQADLTLIGICFLNATRFIQEAGSKGLDLP